MTSKTTTIQTLYVHLVLNVAILTQILYDIVPNARHFLPDDVEFFFQVCHFYCIFFEMVLEREHSGKKIHR